MLKNEIGHIVKLRKNEINDPYFAEIWDEPEILYLLKRNYDETVEFLKNASYDEIGVASCVLEELLEIFPTQEILDCFKSRVKEFTEHDKKENWNKPSIVMNVFKESVEEAEEFLAELTNVAK